MSQLDTTVSPDRPAILSTLTNGSAPQRFSQVRTALIRALRSSPEAREPLCDALEQLEAIQQELEGYQRTLPTEAPAGANGARSGRRRAKNQAYEVQATPDGAFLTERRPGHSQPFRCPRATYDAAAEVLAAADEALPFEMLMELLNARMAQRQPDYRLRVAFRFWTTHQLVVRSRTKYRAVDRGTFLTACRTLWTTVHEGSHPPSAAAHG